MNEEKTFNYGELILNEMRELRRELTQRMDRIESRQDKLDAKIDDTRKELNAKIDDTRKEINDIRKELNNTRKELSDKIDGSKKEMNSQTRHSQTLTATIVSIVVVVIYSVLTH